MIKKAIAYIEGFCKDVKADVDKTDYYYGSRDVAENVLNGLEGLDNIFSIYELNPYAKGADKWEEIAVTRAPDTARDIAEALSKDHNGQIDIRYESSNNSVFQIRRVGDQYRHFKLGSVDV